jgi:peptide/nickel transport system substrate-binding protein
MARRRAYGFMIRGLAVATAAGLLAAGCGGKSAGGSGGSGGSTGKGGGTLTVVAMSPPASLDPAKANVGSDNWFVNLTYDTLTRMGPGGKLQPDLATEWGYVGTGNTDFQLKLRSGVTFADGTPMDAKAVAASLDYIRKSGLNVSWTSAVSSVTATGPLTVEIKCATPNPVLPELLDQVSLMGSVISPAGLANPSKLGTQSFGAGPYVLDASQTASGDHYVYTPNPKYWDQTKIHWKKVVVKVVANPNSALQSVKTGEADALAIIPPQVDSATSAGLSVVHAPIAFLGVNLADRDGTVAKPLKDVRVRQALNYAVDRAAITKAVFQAYGTPTSEISIPGETGFAPDYNDHYTFDVAKAKQLMADAGYPNGFPLKVETQQGLGLDVVTQAVLQQWKAVGVTADVTTDTTIGQWLGNATSKQFPVLGFGYGAAPSYVLSLDWMTPHTTAFNPFATQDPQLTAMLDKANAAPADQQPALYQDVSRYVVDQAWFVAVARIDGIYAYNGKKITGFSDDPQNFLPDIAWGVAPK